LRKPIEAWRLDITIPMCRNRVCTLIISKQENNIWPICGFRPVNTNRNQQTENHTKRESVHRSPPMST
jgi:hypothetical protein